MMLHTPYARHYNPQFVSVPATCKNQVLTTDRRWYLVFFLKAKIFFQKQFSATVSLLKETLTNRKFQKL